MTTPSEDVTLDDQRRGHEAFLAEVLEGLEQAPPTLPCKYFYDEIGSAIFDEICQLSEYYPTRTELSILETFGPQIGDFLGPQCLVIEPGAGSANKIQLLLENLHDPVAYVPVDISGEHLEAAATSLARDFPNLEILPISADFIERVKLPTPSRAARRNVIFFPGSTIGNFPPEDAVALLRTFADRAGPDGILVLGADLVKSPDTLVAAYDDAQGVTARFNKNLLRRINTELGGDFDLEGFAHQARWDAEHERIEISLVSLRDQEAAVGNRRFSFPRGSRIVTEHSHKYTKRSMEALAAAAGFRVDRIFTDPDRLFSVQLLSVAPANTPDPDRA